MMTIAAYNRTSAYPNLSSDSSTSIRLGYYYVSVTAKL
jgi:hypothetical protein